MRDELEAARKAAYDYNPRNDGEEHHVLFIRAMLDDAALRASYLDDYAAEHDRAMAIHDANDARSQADAQYAAAMAGVPSQSSGATVQANVPASPMLEPDTQLSPETGAPSKSA